MINYLSNDFLRQNDINILFSNLLILLIFLLFKDDILPLANSLPHFCLIDKLFGIECPFCGTTRAFCELSNGNFINAYTFNSSIYFVASFFILQIPLRVYSLINEKSRQNINLFSSYMGKGVFLILIANWIIMLIQSPIMNAIRAF
ncbi:MAG: DUF2752 domain-containing protein [Bacteroidetes bacterium]|nr:DUF2752 domain-containing protein [Bacteroidota bacterium]